LICAIIDHLNRWKVNHAGKCLRNDTEAYYKKIKAAGNKVEKIVLSGQTHNTFVMRKAISDGEDPAKVIADVISKDLSNSKIIKQNSKVN
jgi:hypothetical protein